MNRMHRFWHRAGLWTLAVLLAGGLAACQQQDVDEEVMTEGFQVYAVNCGRCHQSDGSGYAHIYPPMAGNPIVTLHDISPSLRVVLHGSGSMRGFSDSLSNEEIAAVMTYIRNTWGNDAGPVSPRQVQSGFE
jgi:mono/diheme cytochrome c family protein